MQFIKYMSWLSSTIFSTSSSSPPKNYRIEKNMNNLLTQNQDVLIKPGVYTAPTRSTLVQRILAFCGTNCFIKASSRVLLNGTSGSCQVCDRNRVPRCQHRSFGTNIPRTFGTDLKLEGWVKMRGISCLKLP